MIRRPTVSGNLSLGALPLYALPDSEGIEIHIRPAGVSPCRLLSEQLEGEDCHT